MTKDKQETFAKSTMNMSEADSKKETKLKNTELRKRKKEREKKANEKKTVKKSDDNIEQKKGREKNGDFGKGNTFGVGNGRPPIFACEDELAKKIDLYIDNCPDTRQEISGHVVLKIKTPTISGMAYFLGFESRQSMYDYKNKDNGFSYIIKRAMLYMEKHYEQIIQGKAPTGAIFALKNMEWRDKSEVDNNHKFIGQASIQFGDTSKKEK